MSLAARTKAYLNGTENSAGFGNLTAGIVIPRTSAEVQPTPIDARTDPVSRDLSFTRECLAVAHPAFLDAGDGTLLIDLELHGHLAVG